MNARAAVRSPAVLNELIQMIRTDDLESTRRRLGSLDWPDRDQIGLLIQAARLHGLEAWLAACAPTTEGPWSELSRQRPRFLAAQARSRSTIRAVGQRIDRLGVPWAVLKGLSIAMTGYPRSDLRQSVDIDVLVPPAAFACVVEALINDGFQLLDVNWPVIADRFPGQLRLRAPTGPLIDLHWHLLNAPRLRTVFRLATGELLARSVPLAELRMLSAEDRLMHLGLHAALAGANRLSWLVDLDRSVRGTEFDWNEVIGRSRLARCGASLAVALQRAQRVLDTPIPTTMLRTLAGGRARLAVQRLMDARTPIGFDPSEPRLARSSARSARDGWWPAFSELSRHGAGWLRRMLPDADNGSWLDPGSDTSALFPVPDDLARARYFEAVSAQDDPHS
jgi:hypothetical protein